MKLLFDFLPIVLFFGTFKYAEGHKDWAAALASESLGFMVAGGTVGPNEAPVLLATVVVILATLGQVGYLMAKRQKIDMMLWVSLVLVVGLGGCHHLVPQRHLHQMETLGSLLGDGAGPDGIGLGVQEEPPQAPPGRTTQVARTDLGPA